MMCECVTKPVLERSSSYLACNHYNKFGCKPSSYSNVKNRTIMSLGCYLLCLLNEMFLQYACRHLKNLCKVFGKTFLYNMPGEIIDFFKIKNLKELLCDKRLNSKLQREWFCWICPACLSGPWTLNPQLLDESVSTRGNHSINFTISNFMNSVQVTFKPFKP